MNTILTTAAIVAGKKAFEKSIEQIIKQIPIQSKQAIEHIKQKKKINDLYKKLGNIRYVKTIGQLDKPTDLTSFYCDSHVLIQGNRTKIKNINDLGNKNNVLIEGIAGQGKSILLRYLASIELMKGDYIPLFIELRKIKKNFSIIDQIIETLDEFKLKIDKSILHDLIETGKIILFLDAFDEIAESLKKDVITEIEHLHKKYSEKLKIIISSRPNNGIESCAFFNIVRLDNLRNEEYANVITKLFDNHEAAEQLITHIRQHKGEIKNLLITPLFVTLLVIKYKSFQELPQQLADFYDSIFSVLMQRHDGTKPGYKRPRQCSLNDIQYEQVFETFCYHSKFEKTNIIDHRSAYSLSQKSLEEKEFQEDSQKFLNDIVKITCLLVRDGEEYRFIHKSIQEYYTATYLKGKPQLLASKFYPALFDRKNWPKFGQELMFLKEMDPYRFYKYGALPQLEKLFKTQENIFDRPYEESHVNLIQEIIETNSKTTLAPTINPTTIDLTTNPKLALKIHSFIIPTIWPPIDKKISEAYHLFFVDTLLAIEVDEDKFCKEIYNTNKPPKAPYTVSVKDLYKFSSTLSDSIKTTSRMITEFLFMEGNKAKRITEKNEKEDSMEKLF